MLWTMIGVGALVLFFAWRVLSDAIADDNKRKKAPKYSRF
jgi:hypothetical protein